MSTLADKAQDVATTTEDSEFTCHTTEAVSEMGQAIKADAQELRYFTEDYIVEHPLKTAGIALGVGFLLGVLWTRG